MKIFRKLLLALLVLAALRVPCFAQEAFHGAYLQGFPDGSIRPEKQVTRAELAEILYRMISPDAKRELTSESFGTSGAISGHMRPSARWRACG